MRSRLNSVYVVSFITNCANERDEHSHHFWFASCHHRVGRDLLNSRRAIIGRYKTDDLVGLERGLCKKAIDSLDGRWNHWQRISKLDTEFKRIGRFIQLDASGSRASLQIWIGGLSDLALAGRLQMSRDATE